MRFVRKGPGRCPCCCVCTGLLVVVVTIVVGVLLKPPNVETNFDSFLKTDVNTSTMRDTFLYALSKRSETRRLQAGSILYKPFDLSIVYDLKEGVRGGRGLLDVEILNEIARFEQSLRDMPEWREFCAGVDPLDKIFCEVGMSFISYAMPSLTVADGSIVPSSLKFDGQGREPIPLETAVLSTEDLGLSKIMLPADFTKSNMSVSQLRSAFRFKFRCCTSLDTMTYQRQVVGALNKRWNAFVTQTMIPKLQNAGEDITLEGEQEAHPVRIYFQGSGFEEIEVMQTLDGDKNLAGGSVGFVLLYMLLHTRSLLLSIMGLLIIAMSVPFSYVIFAVFTGSQTMSIASFLSLFLIVGLGSDVVFVYNDFWQESKAVKVDLNSRLAWTLWHAGKASFATTATTAVSFFANLASVLKPLREFGFFMGLCVLLAWVLLTLIFVPLCLLDEKYPCKRIFCMCPRHSSDEPSRTAKAFGWWMIHLHRWRRVVVPLAAVFSVAFLGWAAGSATTDTGVPNIFPKDHNQNRGKEVFGSFTAINDVFDPLFLPPRDHADVCSELDFRTPAQASCSLFWCEAKPDRQAQEGTCQCFKKQRPKTCGMAVMASVVQRFVGPTVLSLSQLGGPVANHIVHAVVDKVSFQAGRQRTEFMTRRDISAPLVLQEWESGDVMLKSVVQVESAVVREAADASCGWEEICYCGTYVCKTAGTGFRRNTDLQLSIQRRLSAAAPPQQWMVPSNMRATVDVIFGIQVNARSPLLGEVDLPNSWTFDYRHEVRQPWAQRNMYSFCTNLPQELRVTSQRCWIEDFRSYVVQRGRRFPLPRDRFDDEVGVFAATSLTGMSSSQDFLWIRGGEVKASFVSFSIDIQKYAATELALEHQKKWDQYLARYNADASRFARDAWHSSSLWVRAEAQDALIMSTVITLLIVILLAFLGMVVFTRNATLSLSVVFATCGVVANLFFYITVMMGWAIGPIEVIALIVFIGYAVTYSLHIAHRYGSSDAANGELPEELSGKLSEAATTRYLRTRFALQTIGGAALGSAVTTAGSSIFLIFCTLTIFKKLGGVVLAVTILSIFFALVPLPATLLMVGPTEPGRRCLPSLSDLTGCLNGMEEGLQSMLSWRPWSPKPREEESPASAAAPPAAPGTGSRRSGGERRLSNRPPVAEPPYGVAEPPYGGARAQPQPAGRYAPGPPPGGAPNAGGGMQPGAHSVVRHLGLPHGSQQPAGPGANAASAASAAAANDRRRRLSEMDFDIGTESPLECIWAREAGGGGPRPPDGRRSHPRPVAATL